MIGPVKSPKAKLEGAIPTRAAKAKGLLSLRGVVCLLLGFMVFAWGTNYRLSLYKTEHRISPAKVCTRGSDAAKNALDHVADGHNTTQSPPGMAVLSSLFPETRDLLFDRLSDDSVIDLSPLSSAPILYLRPPPDELLSLA
jgi:hypothetical protein